MKNTTIIKILTAGLCVLGYLYYQQIKENTQPETIYNQNVAALNDEIKKIKKDSTEMYHKYVSVQENLAEKEKILKEQEETVLYQSKTIVQLKRILEKTSGNIIKPDSLTGDEFCFEENTYFTFSGGNKFYTYWDTVWIGIPPTNKLDIEFSSFGMVNYLSRNKEGKWSGYAKFEPEYINNYLTITAMDVVVERDEFIGVESRLNKFTLDVIPKIGAFTNQAVYLKAGIGFLINNRHYFEYEKGIGNDFHFASYGREFSLIGR